MAIYAIGDVQGCYSALRHLLDELRFTPTGDRLWFVGDLVNRGPESLATLRFVKSLGDAAVCVLGNHDLHLLAVAAERAKPRSDDTIEDVLQAPDRDEVLAWLRNRPLMYRSGHFAMVHAGLLPQWSVNQASELAREVEAALQGPGFEQTLADLYGNAPDRWSESLIGGERLRVIVNAMTRMRVCDATGVMDLRFKGEAADIPPGRLPWYAIPGRRSAGTPIIFGHWSALGLLLQPDALGLDTGCVWGGCLSAIRVDDRQVYQVSCPQTPAPTREQ